jgi:hypothetical protein
MHLGFTLGGASYHAARTPEPDSLRPLGILPWDELGAEKLPMAPAFMPRGGALDEFRNVSKGGTNQPCRRVGELLLLRWLHDGDGSIGRLM